jgi:hypothetical protein
MAAPGPGKATGASAGVGALSMPDTSSPGSVAAPSPATWVYDYDPGTGSSRATYNGEVSFASGGSVTAGVTTFNTRSGAVTLTAADVTGAGGATAASPSLTGTPLAPTAAPGTSTTQIATTAYVQQAITANPIVQSWNGRSGAVTLTTSDITGAGGAPASSPALIGTPTTPTAAQGTQNSQIASTMFVANAIAAGTVTSWNGRQGGVSLTLSDVMSVGGAPIASPVFTGVPAGTTAAPGTATTQLATCAFVTNAVVAASSGVVSFNGRNGAVTLQTSDVVGAGGAPIVSPTFTGTPAAPTPTAGDSSTKLATTAFVGTAIASLPAGVATFNGRSGTVTLQLTDVTSVGGAPLASPTFSGTPKAVTPTPGDNSINIATTAFVAAALPVAASTNPIMDGTAAIGTATPYARADHVHPSDTSRYAASNPSGFQTAAQVTASLGNYLPLTGGTITGTLTTTSDLSTQGNLTVVGAANTLTVNGSAYVGGQGVTYTTYGNHRIAFNWTGSALACYIDGIASGNVSGVTSDARVKTVLGAYLHGLAEIEQLEPILYQYKGNDTAAPPDADATAPYSNSLHHQAAIDAHELIGLVAQDCEAALPEIVQLGSGYIDGQHVDDIRSLDTRPLTFALINAVKELAQRVRQLENAI